MPTWRKVVLCGLAQLQSETYIFISLMPRTRDEHESSTLFAPQVDYIALATL